METIDVLVIGAGPTGLTAAGDLARLGRSVTVLERRSAPSTTSRAFAVMPRTLELLDSRGLADDLVAGGHRTGRVRLFGRAEVDLARVDSPYPFALVTPQARVDAALESYAVGHGAHLVRGTDVVALEQDATGVTVTTRPSDPGTPTVWRAAWVVAADGAHSTVRRLLGIPFPGRTVLSSVVLADIRPRHEPQGDGLTVGSTPDAFAFLAPYGDGWFRSMTWERHRQLPDTAPVDDDGIAPVLRAALGQDVGVAQVRWRSRFHCDERQVERYRHGRVLLAGDAAHVHSPVGGQGMNTGIQDAVNLAWKLDAVLAGADDAVIDSYQTERHPIGRLVVRQSGMALRAIILRPRPLRWLRERVASIALRQSRIAGLISGNFTGVGLRYPAGGGHRLVGTRAVAVPLDGDGLLRRQRTPGFLLVRERGADPLPTPVRQAERTDDGPALLVRPDGYVAWAGAGVADASWHEALARWTGRWQERAPRAILDS